VIIDFYDKGTEDVYNGINSRQARKTLPVELRRIALRRFYFLENAVNLKDLRMPPGTTWRYCAVTVEGSILSELTIVTAFVSFGLKKDQNELK
jgi:proteic killer suppression protein